MRALIAGGGIGGLAAVVALQRAGVEAVVLEKVPEFAEVGGRTAAPGLPGPKPSGGSSRSGVTPERSGISALPSLPSQSSIMLSP